VTLLFTVPILYEEVLFFEQRYNGGKILPGAKLRWGTAINLVIGGGLAEVQL